ncbi:type II secretion system protein GspJ [Sedimentisphaera salicampi]|uniref:Type II secretion system protein J n=1 Tax=Sedimentisphaera salicampi TaxID=1941349 RepID=A0A1W6LP81_9BACT|nr:type II secretion system protein GspJ [Sedimentisphaera salicampi]ARN57546.1 type II secretion system protein J [Sedimentisphaera salicampi]
MKKAGANRECAFTLIELVMAMALINIIALSLYSSLHIAFRAKDSAETALQPYRTIVPVFESIRRDLTCTPSPDGTLFGEFTGESDEQGDFPADQLSFFSASLSGEAEKQTCNIAEITYALTSGLDEVPAPARVNIDEQKKNLLVRYVRYNPLSKDAEQLNEDILFEGVRSLEIEYYYQGEWLEEWDSQEKDGVIPQAVRFSIQLSDSQKNEEKEVHKRLNNNGDNPVYSKTFLLRCYEGASEDSQGEANAGQL